MCGIVAVISKYKNGFIQEQADVFEHLLLVDTLRGFDSTGAFMVHMNGDVDIAKEASTGGEFLTKKGWKDMRGAAIKDGGCLIGHNRKATKGNVNDENAHPFAVDDKIVLVHNGGIFGDHKKLADVEVDSHAIAHLLVQNEKIEDALGEFYGAYALMWYDVEKEELHIIRNKERPMWFMETQDSWIWASERSFLAFAGNRVGVKVLNEPRPLEEDSLNTFSLVDRQWKPSYRKLVPNRKYTPVTNVSNDNQWSHHGHRRRAVNTWERDLHGCGLDTSEDDSCAFEAVPSEETRKGRGVLNVPFFCTVGGNNWAHTSEFEREMAKGCNKVITAGEFNREVPSAYLWLAETKCEAFEYIDDGEGGFYLYASPLDDPQVIFRHHFVKETKVEESRIMQMALNGWILNLKVEKKCWAPFNKDILQNLGESPVVEGYCIIISAGCTIVKGGGHVAKKEGANA